MSMHLIFELWDAVDRGEIPPRVLVEIAKQHFFALCPVCAEEFRRFQGSSSRKGLVPDAAAALAVLKEQVARLRKEARAAEKDVADLMATPPEKRQEKIHRARTRYRGTAVVHGILSRYWKVIYSDPRKAGQLAELAWTAAKGSHGAPRIHELVALAASCIGNAARAAGDLDTADRWFRHVRSLLNEEDVRSASVLAKIDWLEGSLRKDQRRLQEAVDTLNRALTLFKTTGMRVDMVRVLLTLGETHYVRGRMKTAAGKAQEALRLVDREAEPRLHLCAQHNLALYLSEQGKYSEAAQILNANASEYADHGDVSTTLHLAWLGGRIAAGLGDVLAAEESFRSAREGFLARGNVYLAALVCLDLSLLYLRQQRLEEVKTLATAMVPIFEAQAVHREASAAWLLFLHAAEQETVTDAFLKRLARYLEASRADPSFRFEL